MLHSCARGIPADTEALYSPALHCCAVHAQVVRESKSKKPQFVCCVKKAVGDGCTEQQCDRFKVVPAADGKSCMCAPGYYFRPESLCKGEYWCDSSAPNCN